MAGGSFPAFVEQVRLIDHHVHGAFLTDGGEERFQNSLNEGNNEPLANPRDTYNTQIGFAIRRWCSGILDLPRHASPADYWNRRSELAELEVSRRMTRAAGVSDWLIDTGLTTADYLGLDGMADVSGGRTHEIVRLEVVAEQLIREIANPADYVEEFGQRLQNLTLSAVGVKTVLAYRAGFDQNLSRPTPAAVTEAARRWRENLGGGTRAKLTDVTLIAHGIYTAVSMKLPLQFHVGFGDRDLDLHKTNPLYLLDFLRSPEVRDTPIMLLHCYPFEREAGYLAHAFENVYIDVGLAVNFTGSRSRDLVARSFELAPFTKILYSSDAFGPAELHYLGARLWRNAITKVVGGWIDDDDWSEADARKIVQLIAHGNARRVYALP
ncbi:amidohydrolase family protein [Arthrobacter sp. ISL-28]|uniref:amidohydrolase family protein n=1 Tax=Arthrobacter sp. ISL-28 TaxID=2819108 RepID=UPI001BE69B1C|nr:amidohydrolase family protein [Arthrobacter sp. ISL-28]MBT2521527.1 amidohydrolase family protein [Arthrobacter sp. ISL-28]